MDMTAQLVASQSQQSKDIGSTFGTSDTTQVGQFLNLNLPKFTDIKVEKDPLYFVDDMEKIFE